MIVQCVQFNPHIFWLQTKKTHVEPTLDGKLPFTMLILMTSNHQLQQNKVTPASNRKSKQQLW